MSSNKNEILICLWFLCSAGMIHFAKCRLNETAADSDIVSCLHFVVEIMFRNGIVYNATVAHAICHHKFKYNTHTWHAYRFLNESMIVRHLIHFPSSLGSIGRIPYLDVAVENMFIIMCFKFWISHSVVSIECNVILFALIKNASIDKFHNEMGPVD